MTRRRLHSAVETVIGFDLSLTAAAACALPRIWNQDMARARTIVVGYGVGNDEPESMRVERLEKICTTLVDFCLANKATAINIEEYAFSSSQSRAHAIGELGGVVKLECKRRLGLTPQPVTASHARKTLLQWLPGLRGKPKGYMKRYVVANVQRLGKAVAHWTEDEIDAFVVSNYCLMAQGGLAMTFEGDEGVL